MPQSEKETSPEIFESILPSDASKTIDDITALTKLDSDLAVLGFSEFFKGIPATMGIPHNCCDIHIHDKTNEIRLFFYTDPWQIFKENQLILKLEHLPEPNKYMIAIRNHVWSHMCNGVISTHTDRPVNADQVIDTIDTLMKKIADEKNRIIYS